jgi:mevalonate kinase
MGEHAAVYGAPALVAAIDRRVRVEIGPGTRGLDIHLESYDLRIESTWSEILDYSRRAAEDWSRWAVSPDRPFASGGGRDPARVVKIALGEAARSLASLERPALSIEVGSELPIGSGFGSSAAVAVGTVAALLASLGVDPEPSRVEPLALEVERRQHGRPSGVDHATVIDGGVLALAGGRVLETLAAAGWVLRDLQLFDTGAPAESTGEVVTAVARYRQASRAHFDELLERMASAVSSFRAQLVTETPRTEEVAGSMNVYQRCLEKLGVVPRWVRQVVRRVEAAGGAAKISGAGGLGETGAGCLLVYSPESTRQVVAAELASCRQIGATIGAEGLRWERLW